MAHREKAQIRQKGSNFLRVRKPGSGGFQGQIDKVELVLRYAMDLFEDRTSRKVHCAHVHADDYPLPIMDALELIKTRRSVPKLGGDAPDRATIQKLLDAAVRAPNHHLTEPWRFIVLSNDALDELGDAWARGTEREGGDPEKVRDKPHRAPAIIAVIERPKSHHDKVVEMEEHHAVGAAMQNILLAAHGLGLGTMLRTGPATRLSEVEEYLGLKEGEFIAGFIYLGQPPEGDEVRNKSRRTDAAELTEWRT
jgi:nitroreductase